MLSAIVDDFSCVPGVEVRALLNSDVRIGISRPEFVRVGPGNEETTFRELSGKADFTLVIAPELDGVIVERCEWVKKAGGRLLGPSVAALRLTSDKYALSQNWKESNVPTPRCWLAPNPSHASRDSKEWQFPVVLKPRTGAGSLNTFLIRHPDDWARAQELTIAPERPLEWIVQEFVPGLAASLAFLIGPNERLALPPARQDLSKNGRFRYLGGEVPLPGDLALRAGRLASRAIDCIAGLHGYVGVDLVLGPSPDGSQDFAIEINPRLTTSYIGLMALAKSNLAGTLLRIARGQTIQPLQWGQGAIQFRSDGQIIAKNI